MQFLEDPSEMTPEQRLTEIAKILAAGVRHVRSIDTILGAQDSSPLTEKRLDLSGPPTPPCDQAVNGPRHRGGRA